MEIFYKYFSKYSSGFCAKLTKIAAGILGSGSASTGLISQYLAVKNGTNFKTEDMFVYRFLSDKNFQIDDSFWRCHINMIFGFLKEKTGLKQNDNIQINVDYTTINDDFLILSASINIENNKAIMLYFSSRNYPKRKNSMSCCKMEGAFFKALKHILPKKYTYTIVADRGFGLLRIIELCEKMNFNFALRINENLIIKKGEETFNLKDFRGKNAVFEAEVIRWKKHLKFVINTDKNSTWFLVTNLANADVAVIYSKRFKIEKCFQDMKSSGFDIEKTKIKKYDRMKRLLYLISVSHAFSVFLGCFMESCKKNFENHLDVATAFLKLEKWLSCTEEQV